MRICGVDPGVSGAICLIRPDGKLVARDMPTFAVRVGKSTRHRIDATALSNILREMAPDHAIIEQVGPRNSDGPAGAFSFGEAFGIVRGVVCAMAIPHTFVMPTSWRRAMGVSLPAGSTYADRKEASRRRAVEMFPADAPILARKRDADRAEAALLAAWGLRYAATVGAHDAE